VSGSWSDAEASASSGASASCYGSAENVRILAMVMMELELRQIERQIFGADIVIGADYSALQEAPQRFDVVRVNLAANVLARLVIDRLMVASQAKPAISGVRIDRYQINAVAHCP
jgi:hypothetical protein